MKTIKFDARIMIPVEIICSPEQIKIILEGCALDPDELAEILEDPDEAPYCMLEFLRDWRMNGQVSHLLSKHSTLQFPDLSQPIELTPKLWNELIDDLVSEGDVIFVPDPKDQA